MQVIKDKVLEYMKLKVTDFEKDGNSFTCPKCRNTPTTAHLIPNTVTVSCAICRQIGDIYSIVPLVEPEHKGRQRETIDIYIKNLFNIEIVLKKDKDDVLDYYEGNCFDMVPVVARGKAPIEKGWTTKTHRDKKEWIKWLKEGLNIGVKTGKVSGIIVIDIDTPEVPEEAKALFKDNTLIQKTNKGFHYFYQYDPELRKTRIQDLKIDIETDGGQVVLTPSEVEGVTRSINFRDIQPMPVELKSWLKGKLLRKKPAETNASSVVPESTENFEAIPEGGRHHMMMHLAGIFRKKFNREDTVFTLDVVNKRLMNPPLNSGEFRNVINSIDTYRDYDNQELVNKILKYIEIAEEASPRDIKEALGIQREPIDKALKHLTQEGFLIRKRKQYQIVKKAIWRDTFVDDGQEIDFVMPYFHDYAKFRSGDMIVIGAKTGVGKTHLAMNIIKDLVDQGIKPNYISLESGSRWATIAKGLGMAERQFNWCVEFTPEGIELEDKAVTILDWLLPDVYADTDKLFKKFAEQLVKHEGILIIFVQLMNDELSSFFAKNMIAMFPAFVTKFLYRDDIGTLSEFKITKMREPLGQYKHASIPCRYDFATKRLLRIEDKNDK